jgi:hypothetical protein
VRVNAIAPAARTRLTPGLGGSSDAEVAPGAFDVMDPANISPWVGYLGTAECPLNGKVFLVMGGEVHLFKPFSIVDKIEKDGRWSIAELVEQGPRFDVKFDLGDPWNL